VQNRVVANLKERSTKTGLAQNVEEKEQEKEEEGGLPLLLGERKGGGQETPIEPSKWPNSQQDTTLCETYRTGMSQLAPHPDPSQPWTQTTDNVLRTQ